MISCCTVADYCVSPGRMPQPCRTSGLTIVAAPSLTEVRRWLPTAAAQMSPPVAVLFWAPGLSRLQSTTLFVVRVGPAAVGDRSARR